MIYARLTIKFLARKRRTSKDLSSYVLAAAVRFYNREWEKKMTVKDLKNLLKEIPNEWDDWEVVTTAKNNDENTLEYEYFQSYADRIRISYSQKIFDIVGEEECDVM